MYNHLVNSSRHRIPFKMCYICLKCIFAIYFKYIWVNWVLTGQQTKDNEESFNKTFINSKYFSKGFMASKCPSCCVSIIGCTRATTSLYINNKSKCIFNFFLNFFFLLATMCFFFRCVCMKKSGVIISWSSSLSNM